MKVVIVFSILKAKIKKKTRLLNIKKGTAKLNTASKGDKCGGINGKK